MTDYSPARPVTGSTNTAKSDGVRVHATNATARRINSTAANMPYHIPVRHAGGFWSFFQLKKKASATLTKKLPISTAAILNPNTPL